MYKNLLKRIIDFTLSLIGLIILSPLFFIVTIALTIANGGKPFFFQPRPGRNEKMFKVIKFKSMNDKKDANGNLLPDADRMTKAGSFVRKTSLDELPQYPFGQLTHAHQPSSSRLALYRSSRK